MELVLERKYKKEEYTIGVLTHNGVVLCSTIEDRDYGFTKESDVKEIQKCKIDHPQAVAIPTGRYEVSTRYYRGMATRYPFYRRTSCKGNIPCLIGVPGYTGILIHCGNTAKDSAGCIIVGYNTKVGELTDSKKAFIQVCDLIMEHAKRGEKVYITIK